MTLLKHHLARRPLLACGLALTAIVVAVILAPRILAEPTDPASPEVDVQEEEPVCTDSIVKERCLTIESGDSTWRYAYYPGARDANETVIFDPGGPGTSVLAGQFNLEQLRLELGSQYHLIVVEEPWVTAETPESCAVAASEYYRALRQSLELPTAEADEWGAACTASDVQFGFTADSYARVIEAIVDKHGLNPVGFLGHSFASARLAYLTDSTVGESLQWAVIARPFPVGAVADEIIESRATAIRDSFGDVTFDTEPVEIATRSLPVTAFDYRSALVGMGYVHDDKLQLATDALVTGTDPATIGALSDQLWMRYGVDSISPGMIAQMQEVCGALGPLPSDETLTSLDDGPEGILTAQMLPCTTFGTGSSDLRFQEGLSICIAISEQDLVTPADLARTYFESYEILEVPARSHGSDDGWAECHQSLTEEA